MILIFGLFCYLRINHPIDRTSLPSSDLRDDS